MGHTLENLCGGIIPQSGFPIWLSAHEQDALTSTPWHLCPVCLQMGMTTPLSRPLSPWNPPPRPLCPSQPSPAVRAVPTATAENSSLDSRDRDPGCPVGTVHRGVPHSFSKFPPALVHGPRNPPKYPKSSLQPTRTWPLQKV
ncbi:hypothetical protein KC19_VG238900 [Ceratodon purpureus]|uniref:Uncharacterized protein n=1 Tax=Ceratodon purpureus TaxID=3225 RepID=A0A8T0HTU7_CERPU|nr:hypothetical protein KC19_VG238900 [Ceratodon purpureus]